MCVCVCVCVCVSGSVCQELTTQAEDVKVLMGSQNHQIRAKDDPCRFLQVVVHLNSTVARATVGNHSGLVISLRGGGREGGVKWEVEGGRRKVGGGGREGGVKWEVEGGRCEVGGEGGRCEVGGGGRET